MGNDYFSGGVYESHRGVAVRVRISPCLLLFSMHDADGVDGRGNIRITQDMGDRSR